MNKKLIRRVVIVCFIALFLIAVYFLIGKPMLRFVGDKEALNEYLSSQGLLGYIVFAAFVAVQTLSNCIPGTPFYLAAGYCLGSVKGALLCDVGATVGNTLAFILGRKFGRKLLDNLFTEKQIQSVDEFVERGNPKLIHILFMLLPLPKDTYAWFGYYSGEKLITWIILTFIFRFPHIFVYSFSGSQLEEQRYGVMIAAIIFAVVLYAGVAVYLKKTRNKH